MSRPIADPLPRSAAARVQVAAAASHRQSTHRRPVAAGRRPAEPSRRARSNARATRSSPSPDAGSPSRIAPSPARREFLHQPASTTTAWRSKPQPAPRDRVSTVAHYSREVLRAFRLGSPRTRDYDVYLRDVVIDAVEEDDGKARRSQDAAPE